MTDQQLNLAIGLPIVANSVAMLLGFTLLSGGLNKRIDDLRGEMVARFEAADRQFASLERIFDAKLSRVEEVLDARLKHLEER